jgi:CheY-like chemotaxis protein
MAVADDDIRDLGATIGRRTVLLVEDERDSRMLMSGGLEARGYRVLTAANGLEALRLLEDDSIEVLVTDILMPEMDGVELLFAAQSARPNLPIIAMTGSDPRSLDLYLRTTTLFGVTDRIAKPFRVNEVARRIEAALSQKGDSE